MFEIEFTDRDGSIIRRRVSSHAIARQLARDLAIAHGRRAIVRTVGQFAQPVSKPAWNIMIINAETGELSEGREGLTTREAWQYWRNWPIEDTGGIVVLWPESIPIKHGYIRAETEQIA